MEFSRNLQRAEKYLSVHDPVIARLIKLYGPCKLQPHSDHYGELVSSIVGQQLSTKAAATIWSRVLALFGGRMPAPGQLLEIEDHKLRSAGVSRPKISYMKDLAQHIIDKRLDLEHLSTMPNEQLIEQLTAVKGIGEWSAHMFMIFSLGRLDILPTGDLGIRKAIQRHYGLAGLPDPPACITVANQNGWHPYESVASWYLWKGLDNSPNEQTRHDT